MNVPQILKTIGEQISAFASGKLAFAEPVTVADRVVIPVAWVRYDFGAGGSTPAAYRRMAKEAGGGGGGGQVSVIPAGIIEITPSSTRFIPIPDGKKIFALIASSFASTGMNNGGAQEQEGTATGDGKAPSKKQVAAYKSANKKAAGKRSSPAANKTAAKKSAAKKTVAKKTTAKKAIKATAKKAAKKSAAKTR